MPGFLAEALTWDENSWAIPVLKTARSWKIPPLTLLSGDHSGWDKEENRLLAVALTLLEDESCKSCGMPVWLGHSSNNEVVFDLKTTTCYGCAEVDKAREAASRKSKPGETHYVIPRNVWEGGKLPGRYEEYRRGLT
jgi:hypothetical protein